MTLLSLERARADFVPESVPVETYHRLFTRLFSEIRPFVLCLRGLSATPEAVLAQGYVPGGELNALRDTLRCELGRVGLAAGLDARYHAITAHVTFLRFQAPLHDPAAFFAQLTAARNRDFGACWLDRVDCVVNDWYMSERKLQFLGRYALRGG